jgi:hypothetical protein
MAVRLGVALAFLATELAGCGTTPQERAISDGGRFDQP